ncbi:hypothetical protein WJX74_000214 [Apatococcus lobatus]|uniref:Uncharacterized protein n=2 Tax=Apatococcus TaxID=904362 RepID=A0AAW1SVM8_9CHLO
MLTADSFWRQRAAVHPHSASKQLAGVCRGAHRGRSLQRIQASQVEQQDGPLVRLAVSTATAALRLLQGREKLDAEAAGPPQPRPRSVQALMRCIQQDFERGYIITGVIGDEGYSPDCLFGDPTVSFTGLAKWKRNLKLLIPFLEQPSLDLKSLERLPRQRRSDPLLLRSVWRLETYLRFPWRPLISVLGVTVYTIDQQELQVTQHIETWDISGVEAIGQIFRPSTRSQVPFLRPTGSKPP